jgi:hypothetical protein
LVIFIADVRELEKGMELTKRELDNRMAVPPNVTMTKEQQTLKSNQNQSLQDFVSRASVLVSKLRSDANSAQSAFKECAEYFGEDTKTADCNAFFGYFVRFNAMWKTAEVENIQRRKLLEAEKAKLNGQKETAVKKASQVNMKHAVINELKTRNHTKPFIKPVPSEFQDGTFEDIILGMKSEPYRTNINEGMRKSFRRQRSDGMAISSNETEAL